jgi:outer membrane lipoprotein-sorting protein
MRSLLVLTAALGLAAQPARSASPAPTAAEVLARVDAILAPPEHEAKITFVTHKAKGETRSFSMHLLEKGDKMRVRFLAPPDDAGAEVLRLGNDFWNYLPNLKRALKISARQEFHGGDFANSDVLRADMSKEYDAAFAPGAPEGQWLLDLKARSDASTYARIKLWVRKQDNQPLEMKYFSASGLQVRTLTLSEQKKYGTLVRPSHYVMRNMLEPKRYSEMTYNSFTLRKGLDDALFGQAALGR